MIIKPPLGRKPIFWDDIQSGDVFSFANRTGFYMKCFTTGDTSYSYIDLKSGEVSRFIASNSNFQIAAIYPNSRVEVLP